MPFPRRQPFYTDLARCRQNSHLLDILLQLSFVRRHSFYSNRAFLNAATTVAASPYPLTASHNLNSLPAIGGRIARILREALDSEGEVAFGMLSQVERVVTFDESCKHHSFVAKRVEGIDPKLILTVTGHHRRFHPLSHRVHFLLTHPECGSGSVQYSWLYKLIRVLTQDGYVINKKRTRMESVSMEVRLTPESPIRNVVLEWISYDHFIPRLLFSTGPKEFTNLMMLAADASGYTLTADTFRHKNPSQSSDGVRTTPPLTLTSSSASSPSLSETFPNEIAEGSTTNNNKITAIPEDEKENAESFSASSSSSLSPTPSSATVVIQATANGNVLEAQEEEEEEEEKNDQGYETQTAVVTDTPSEVPQKSNFPESEDHQVTEELEEKAPSSPFSSMYGAIIQLHSEKELFALCGVPYIYPIDRYDYYYRYDMAKRKVEADMLKKELTQEISEEDMLSVEQEEREESMYQHMEKEFAPWAD